MASSKISALTSLTGADTATDDVYAIVDTSASVTKKQSIAQLKLALMPAPGAIGGTTPAAGSFASLTMSGAIAGADNQLGRVNLIDYGEVTNAIGGTGGGTQSINLTLGNSVSATVDTSTNTFTFDNPTASDEACSFTLVLTNGGSQTVNWPGTVDWAGASAPSLTSSGVDILCFLTIDGGSIWHGFAASLNSS
jgi:hypothetical protein